MIGIVGGTGPYAGLDLLRKVFDNTLAGSDQEHLDVVLMSLPSLIPDRTEFLLGKTRDNPAYAIAEILIKLEVIGSRVAGIACNTAHADRIFGLILQRLRETECRIRLLNMIDETTSYLGSTHPGLSRIGVLSTTGTYESGVYQKALEIRGYETIRPTREIQEKLIHPAVYDPEYGIKSCPVPARPAAIGNLLRGIGYLQKEGAQAVILGCTEISMALTGKDTGTLVTIDPTRILARALIRSVDASKLKPEKNEPE
ncbi:MAG TPA: amino acid racemase [Bacteroides sp.]|nr:amino acid racemase [Bacteroides sp.]